MKAAAIVLAAVVGLVAVGGAIFAWFVAPRSRGYPTAGAVVVRCRRGHLFTTLWIPGVSFTALRLGTSRYQRCPVGRHWSLVAPVPDAELTDDDRARAAEFRDRPVP